MSPTASTAAASGRQRKTRSAPFNSRRRSVKSFRLSVSMDSNSMSVRRASRWWICRPVVPSWPSMNTLGLLIVPEPPQMP